MGESAAAARRARAQPEHPDSRPRVVETDMAQVLRMLRSVGIEPVTRADFDGAPGAPVDVVTVTVSHSDAARVSALEGYAGFFVEFRFDPQDGRLVSLGIWE